MLPPQVKELTEVAKINMSEPEFTEFNKAVDAILRADPKAVREAIEKGKKANAERREAKNLPSASDHVSSDKD